MTRYGHGMDTTAMTAVSQLITDARSRFGAHAVRELHIDGELLDATMDHVLALGGQVGLDHAVVEGVAVRELPADRTVPQVLVDGDPEPRPLVALEDD